MSKTRVSKEFKIGITLIVCAALAYFGVNYLKGVNIFQDQDVYSAIYDRVDGLNVSDPVMLNGKRIGQVKRVDLKPDYSGEIIVDFLINIPDFPIPVDTKAVIKSDLLGTTTVDLLLGKSKVLAAKGDTLISSVDLSMTEEFKKELEPLKLKTQELIGGIDEIVTNLQSVFEDDPTLGLPKIFQSLQTTMDNLELTSAKVNSVIDANSGKLSNFMTSMDGIASNLDGNKETLNKVIGNFESISDSLAQSNIKTTIDNADNAVKELNSMMARMNSDQGTIGMLINTDSLHNSLIKTIEEMEFLIDDITENPQRYVHISIFGKKQDKRYSKKELKQLRELIDESLADPAN